MSDFCPLIQKKCKEHKCKFYIQVLGKNPQTGQDVNEWNCAVTWLPMLLIEGSQQTRQAGSAIESFRNEMVKANDQLLSQTTPFLNNTPQLEVPKKGDE
jgi:hypothetical protein